MPHACRPLAGLQPEVFIIGRDMAAYKILRCDCGYRLRARTEERQVAEVRRHAWEAHGVVFSTEEALAVLLRIDLEVYEEAPGDLAQASSTRSGKEKK